MFAVTKENGQLMAMPDVCLTPAPPAPPIPPTLSPQLVFTSSVSRSKTTNKHSKTAHVSSGLAL